MLASPRVAGCMVYRHRSDLAQARMVNELRLMGFSVAITSNLGNDFPDLVIGKFGFTGLVEAKSDKKTHHRPGAGVSVGQREFKAAWRGSPVIIATTAMEVAAMFNEWLRHAGILR